MDRSVEFAYAQAQMDRPMADSPMAAGMTGMGGGDIGMQMAANGVQVPEVQSAHSAHYPYQQQHQQYGPNNYRQGAGNYGQGGNYGQNSNYGQGGNYRRAGRNEPREQYSVMLFDESDDHILCADQYDEFHVTIEHINQPGKIEKFCVFRMRLYEDNYFTLELNQLDKRKIHSTQTHFLSVDFARVHMKQMTLYEASQRMDKSIEWRWSVGEENADIANNNDNYQFMSVTQLPEPSCIHIRSPALSHRQRAHLHDQQLARNKEAQKSHRENSREKPRVRPEVKEDFRETEIVNDQPEELKKLSEVAAGLTTEPQRIETTTVIHRRAKYGSRKMRKRKRKRRRKKPKLPKNSIAEPDPPPKETPKDDLNKMEVIHSNLGKKEESLKKRLKKLKRIKQIEIVKGRHAKTDAEMEINEGVFVEIDPETNKISTSNISEILTTNNSTKLSDSEHKKNRKKSKKRKKGRGRKKKKKNSSSKKSKNKPCPKKWEHQNGVCYRAFTRKRRSYRVAEKYCGRKHAADLFTPDIENKEMAYFASWLAAKHLYNKKYRERMSRNTQADSTIRNREHFIWTGVTEKKRKTSSKSVPVAQALTALKSKENLIDKVSSPNLINKETTKLKRICTATKIGTTAMKPRSCKRKSGFICAKPAS